MADGRYQLEKLLVAKEPLMMRVNRPLKMMIYLATTQQKIKISELIRRALREYMERTVEGFEEKYNRAIDEEIEKMRKR